MSSRTPDCPSADPSGLAPRAIASATSPEPRQKPVALPIWQTTTFRIDDALNEAMADGDYRSEYLYTRMGNPTVRALERRLAELHDAEEGVCTASGMGAISSFYFAATDAGDTVLAASRLYGVTDAFFDGLLRGAGRRIVRVDAQDSEAVARALQEEGVRWLHLETLANPLLHAPDLPRLIEAAREAGVRVCVDNTFANPVVCRPLALGADVVIESLSKSLAGHSDVHGGFVGTRDATLADAVWRAMVHLGPCLDPSAAERIWRGLKTLVLRTHSASENARRLVAHLDAHPAVRRVYFPASPGAWLDAPGSMLSFVLEGGDERALRLLDHLRVIEPATSLGGVESLACLPFNTSHRQPEVRARIGLLPGTVRLSVGCEDLADLVADLNRAIEASERA